MSPGSSTESYPAFARIGLRENPGKNLNQSYQRSSADRGVCLLIRSCALAWIKFPHGLITWHKCPDIPLPPQPVVTRWGTWIRSVVYYSKHFKEVVTVIDKLPETDSAACVKAVKDCLNDSRVKNDIAYITSNFSFIPANTEQLQREKQSLCSQIAIVKEAQVNIHSALGETGKKVKNKWDNVLNKNVGFSLLEKVSRVISGESVNVPVSIDVSIVPNLKFAPLTSVSVERSFSAFKMILSDKRQRLTVENLEKNSGGVLCR
ncbi:hypothetical protein ANN_02087 [Periplaneta americana]|uniref:Uncharacterized protein n=1 Tax=Periplaneta americana TaxID=6978 RepID=A0ABQ8TVD9_PERAM|nr:hypothetical protein ANN_02087 [Periplaneta americana]